MAQRAYPLTIESAGQWSPVGASALAALADESDSTYIVTDQTSSVTRIALAPIADPGTDVGFALKGRVRTPSGSGGMVLRLVQGESTEIARRWHPVLSPTLWTDFSLDIEPAEAALITDFADLHIELTSGMPGYVNAISFLDKPGKHPAFSHSRATVGALCQQFDGSFYQPQIGEIGSHGMRRVRNNLAASDDLTNAAWFKVRTSVSGSKIIENTANDTHYVYQTAADIAVGDTVFTIVAATAAERRYMVIAEAGYSARSAGFDLQTGTLIGSGGDVLGAGVFVEDEVTYYWMRHTITVAARMDIVLRATSGSAPETYTGDGSSGISVSHVRVSKARPGQTAPDREKVTNGVVTEDMLGANKVVNGDFATASDWTLPTGFSITGGALVYDGTGAQYAKAFQSLSGLQVGAVYEIEFTISGLSGTSVNVGLGNVSGSSLESPQTTYISNGTFRKYQTATHPNNTIIAQVNYAVMTPSIDNVRIRKVNYHGWGVDGVQCFATDEYGNDLTVEDALGPELVANGDFNDGATNWSFYDGNTLTPSAGAVASGELTVTGATAPRARQTLTGLVVGKRYRATGSVIAATSSPRLVFAAGLDLTSIYVDASPSNLQRQDSIEWVATNSTAYLGFRGNAAGVFVVDNISVREVYPVRAAGAVRNPAITNLHPYANPTAAQLSTGGTVSDAAGFAGLPRSIAFGNNSVSRYAYRPLTLTGAHVLQVLVKMDDGSAPVCGTNSGDGSADLLLIVEGSFGASTPQVDHLGGGLYRVWRTHTGTGASGNWGPAKYTGNSARSFKVLLFQIHAGTEPRPFVLTDGSTVALSHGQNTINCAALGWATENGGTLIAKYTPLSPAQPAAGTYANVIAGGVTGERFVLFASPTSGQLAFQVDDDSVSQVSTASGVASWTPGQSQIAALRLETNDVRFDLNGANRSSDSSASMPSVTSFAVMGGSVTDPIVGAIEALYYFAPGTVTDAQLLALSAGDLPAIPELA